MLLLALIILAAAGCTRDDAAGPEELNQDASETAKSEREGPDEPRQPASPGAEGTEGSGEAETEAEVGSGTGSVGEVELPEFLDGASEGPRWPKDIVIGALGVGRLEGDPRARGSTAVAQEFFAGLFGGEEVTGSFYDPFTAEEIEETLTSRCDSVRLGIGELLPQGEWGVPFRCMVAGEPSELVGTLFVRDQEVVDGVIEVAERVDRVSPEASRNGAIPF